MLFENPRSNRVFGQIKEAIRGIRRFHLKQAPVQSDLGVRTHPRHPQSVKTILPSRCRCLRLNVLSIIHDASGALSNIFRLTIRKN